MNHPLTDEMIQSIADESLHMPGYEDDLRAAYDLGFKAASQASEGAMKAIIDTIRENSEAMRILAMGDKEEMEDALDALLALEREKDGYEPITLDELGQL